PVDVVVAELLRMLSDAFLVGGVVDAERLRYPVHSHHHVAVLPDDLREAMMADRLRPGGNLGEGVDVDGVRALDQVSGHASILPRVVTAGIGRKAPNPPLPHPPFLRGNGPGPPFASRARPPSPPPP